MKSRLFKTLGITLTAVFAVGAFAGCSGSEKSIDGEAAAITINDETLPFGEVNLFMRYQQAQSYYYMQSLYSQMGSSGAMWDSAYTYEVDEDGNIVEETSAETEETSETSSASEPETTEVEGTYGEYFKKALTEELVGLVALRQVAVNEYGVGLTDEEKASIEETAQKFMSENEDAESTYGVTEDMVKDMLELYAYRAALKPYATEDVDRNVSDEEAAQSTFIYARIAKNDEDEEAAANEEDSETKTNEEILSDAEEVLALLKDAGDVTEDEVSEMADGVNEDFFAMEYSIGKDDDTFADEVSEAIYSLDDGEVYDGVIDTGEYYYLVKMLKVFDEEATETEKENIIAQRESDAYTEACEEWAAEAVVEEHSSMDNITFRDNDVYTMVVPTTSAEETEDSSETSAGSSSETSADSSSESSADSSSESSADSTSEAE